MEYCNQGNLLNYQMQKPSKRLSEEEVIKILAQILTGVQAMHAQYVIHRDLKPENILMHDGIAKLGDFGLCKITN
jgi:serine/threonine-protein kinase ULK/ATG1